MQAWNSTGTLMIALLAVLALAGCAGPTAAPKEGASGGEAPTVAMKDAQFSPNNLRVKAGSTVTWTNDDGMMHTVASDDAGGPLRSGEMPQGGSWTYTFTEPGTYKYHCEPHAVAQDGAFGGMVGTIVVE